MDNARTRKVWTESETLLLLNCYVCRKEEFSHPRKKKMAYARVLEDMISQGFEDVSVTEKVLAGKMRTLLAAYKSYKDAVNKPGASVRKIPYLDELDVIFGDDPLIWNNHTVNLGGGPVEALQQSETSSDLEFEEEPLDLPSPSSSPSPSSPPSYQRYLEQKIELKRKEAEFKAEKIEQLLLIKTRQVEIAEQKLELFKKLVNGN